MHETSAELKEVFRRFESLPDRIDRNRRRLWSSLFLYVIVSSFLVSIALVAGVYLTLLLLAFYLRDLVLFEALGWLTPRVPHIVAIAWGSCAPLFSIWCVRALGKGEPSVLEALQAEPISIGRYPALKSALHEVSIASGVALPRLAVVEDSALNAFVVTHRSKRGWIGVTSGLVHQLNKDELQFVLAHLVARLQDGSARTATILAELFADAASAGRSGTRFVDMLEEDVGDGLFVLTAKGVTAPLRLFYAVTGACLSIGNLAMRRGYRKHQVVTAEYADARGMLFTRDPRAAMGALEKVLPKDNRPGSVMESRFREDIFGALFFAWPTFSFGDDPELVRIKRLREVLGPAGV